MNPGGRRFNLQSGTVEGLSEMEAVARAACRAAAQMDAKAVIVLTRTGKLARLCSKYATSTPIVRRKEEKWGEVGREGGGTDGTLSGLSYLLSFSYLFVFIYLSLSLSLFLSLCPPPSRSSPPRWHSSAIRPQNTR